MDLQHEYWYLYYKTIADSIGLQISDLVEAGAFQETKLEDNMPVGNAVHAPPASGTRPRKRNRKASQKIDPQQVVADSLRIASNAVEFEMGRPRPAARPKDNDATSRHARVRSDADTKLRLTHAYCSNKNLQAHEQTISDKMADLCQSRYDKSMPAHCLGQIIRHLRQNIKMSRSSAKDMHPRATLQWILAVMCNDDVHDFVSAKEIVATLAMAVGILKAKSDACERVGVQHKSETHMALMEQTILIPLLSRAALMPLSTEFFELVQRTEHDQARANMLDA